jgi:hypothetical protein
MATEFIDLLQIEEAAKIKLRALGATTPQILLSKLLFAPEPGKKYLGDSQYTEVVRQLHDLSGECGESTRLPLHFRPALGARLGNPDIGSDRLLKRDRRHDLSQQLSVLRESRDQSAETLKAIDSVEDELRNLLFGSGEHAAAS